jgi:phage tail sheath protein FI
LTARVNTSRPNHTDAERGVHKAPANQAVRGANGLTAGATADEQAPLHKAGVNCLRAFPGQGLLVWGARNLSPALSGST